MTGVRHWWEAPEYDKRAPMVFPDQNPHAPMVRVGKTVSFDSKLMTWVSTPIRVYVGPSHC